jgi:homogentisate 1,2-dioxygenase
METKMPQYIKLGQIPTKRHTTFYREDGELYREELFSTHGFSNIYSNKYHHSMPTKSLFVERLTIEHGRPWQDNLIQNYKLDTNACDASGNFITSRKKLLHNDDCAIYTAKVSEKCSQFYKNAYADELIFIHQGSGELLSEYGVIRFEKWDYIIIPRGTIFQLSFDDYQMARLFIVESFSMLEIPSHYRNDYGQLLETAPYCERDFKTPEFTDPIVEKGEFELIVKFRDNYQLHGLEYHPFDLVGWDGYCYPWAINIKDFAPIVGKIHLPPSIHMLLTGRNFIVCNFVPRLYDFHPQAIPAPYYHNNIDSDEVLYYVDGDFMSRADIDAGYLTLHQKGLPHGPQPGKAEHSIGQSQTDEYAIMVDTFNPLLKTAHVKKIMVEDYSRSWLE